MRIDEGESSERERGKGGLERRGVGENKREMGGGGYKERCSE